MIRWLPYTFVRITFFLIIGILIAIYFPGVEQKLTSISLFVVVLGFLATFLMRRYIDVSPIIFAVLGFSAVMLAGAFRVLQNDARLSEDYIGNVDSIEAYTAVIDSYVSEKEKTWKVSAKLQQVKTQTWAPASGSILLYFRKADFTKPFQYGDVLLIRGRPQTVAGPSNPGEFDYQKYLSYQNIFHQDFINREDVALVGNDPPNVLMKYAIEARIWANGVLSRYVPGENEQSIASALVLGITDGLDNELTHAYASTGAMHVLAVSGLHVSIIYMIILVVLKPLTKTKKGNWLVVLITLLILWSYAFVTGLSPSVLRAVTMFSFMIFAKVISRSTNIFNTIAVSAFFLLVFDPYLIMSVGFQLSYLAVLGIVYLQPMIYSWFHFRLWLPNKIWEISAVSIAAQIATFPLGLLYFHQFPNYFLLSNLFVIPLSFAILILGIALLVAAILTPIAIAVGYCISFLIMLMNLTVRFFESLPFSLIENINITLFECALIFCITITTVLLFRYKRFAYVVAMLIFACVYSVSDWNESTLSKEDGRIVVYRVPGHTAVDFFESRTAFSLIDSTLMADAGKMSYHILPNRIRVGSSNPRPIVERQTSYDLDGARLFIWRGKKVIQVFSNAFHPNEFFSADILIISRNSVGEVEDILERSRTVEKVILDSSNSYRYSEAVKKLASTLNIEVASVLTDGAVEINL